MFTLELDTEGNQIEKNNVESIISPLRIKRHYGECENGFIKPVVSFLDHGEVI